MDLEVELDKILKIKTNGRDDSNSNYLNFPYEPTPYSVLQTLANSGYITKYDKIIDYGSGKGRVEFFLAYTVKAKIIGVEYDIRLYNSSIENQKNGLCSNRVEFINSCASQYNIPDDATGAYFFNPFSVAILREVISNIRCSLNRNKREFKLFFYYPSKEYLEYLNTEDIYHIEDIDCRGLFKEEDKREYIGVYKVLI